MNPANGADASPYARFLGAVARADSGGPYLTVPFRPGLIGNVTLPALHGGIAAALLELSVLQAIGAAAPDDVAAVASLTVTYLRLGRPQDLHARARVLRKGLRVAQLDAIAWQETPEKPVAAATATVRLEAAGDR